METGTTLRENNLSVVAEIVPVSARLVANKAAYQFKNEAVTRLQNALAAGIAERK